MGYFREQRQALLRPKLETETAELDKLRCAIFSIALVSAFVESLFSKMEYNQSKSRSSLSDKMMSAILHVHDAVVGDPMQPLTSNLKLRTHVMSITEKEKMMQNVGAVVCKVFDGRRYHGRIFDVDYHEIHARWMYRVSYSDSDCHRDTEDYWTCEIDNLKCRCADLDHNHTLI